MFFLHKTNIGWNPLGSTLVFETKNVCHPPLLQHPWGLDIVAISKFPKFLFLVSQIVVEVAWAHLKLSVSSWYKQALSLTLFISSLTSLPTNCLIIDSLFNFIPLLLWQFLSNWHRSWIILSTCNWEFCIGKKFKLEKVKKK